MRVLYVEDEKFLAEAVKHNLEKQEIKTDIAFDGEEGLNMAVASIYDCIILDIMLPKLSGLEILERIREKGINTPVIMLSALSEVEDKVRGLNMGADDYLAKPFKTAELVARIMALTRRPQDLQQETISFLDLTYNTDEKSLNGEKMTRKEADIMRELIKTPEHIVKKEYLLSKVWGGEAYGEDNYIEVYISRLRKMLKKISKKTESMTVRGLGYKLVEK